MARNKKPSQQFVDPSPKAYSFSKPEPEALATELTLLNQIRQDEMTLIWGMDDALPLHILTAIAESPTTTSCVGKLEQYTKGSGFSDEGLMNMPINKDGDTLWDLHCSIVQYFVSLDGFTTNFKYNNGGKIVNTYCLPTDSCRFMATAESTEVQGIKYNPYYGTKDFAQRFTVPYSLFNLNSVKDEMKKGIDYEGQAYFYGTKRTLYKHYPVPKFWSGKKWIYADAKMSTYVDKLLSNGFFQSALMKVIGDPNAMSRHPSSMKDVKGTDGVTRKEPTKTNQMVFDEMMAANFSGVEKAATIMAFWALNQDQSIQIEGFPNSTNFELISGTLLNTIRMIALSTEVPGILANLPDSASPLSGQDSLPKAIDFMQSNTQAKRQKLEQFYNTVLLPNLAEQTKARVVIRQFTPAKIAMTIDQNIWDVLSTEEKRKYVKDNTDYPILYETPEIVNPSPDKLTVPLVTSPMPVAPPALDESGNPLPAPPATTTPQQDDILKGLQVNEINRIMSFVNKYKAGKMTLEQAKQLLSGYGLTEDQQSAWLNPLAA